LQDKIDAILRCDPTAFTGLRKTIEAPPVSTAGRVPRQSSVVSLLSTRHALVLEQITRYDEKVFTLDVSVTEKD